MRALAATALSLMLLTGPMLPGLISAPAVDAGMAGGTGLWVFAEPGIGERPVLSLIKSAHKSIKLEIYLITDTSIISALHAAHRRHVDVRVLLEQHPYGAASYAQAGYSELKSAGVNVRWADEQAFALTHEKAMEVDNSRAGIFTFNLSYSGFDSNREFGVIDGNRSDAKAIGAIFNADWNRKPAHVSTGRLVVSPINSRRDLVRLVDSARHTLDLYEEEMDDSSFESHLISAAKRHVRVRLLTSNAGSGVSRLASHGVHVAILGSPYIHAKAIVVDRSRVFVGSENVSSASLDQNREMGIMLGRGQARAVERVFARDWGTASGVSGGGPHGGKGKIKVRVSAHPASVARGQRLTIEGHTVSGAQCTIKVTYPDGYVSHAPEVQGSRPSGRSGWVSWSWHVGSTVTGKAHALVRCYTKKAHGSGSTAFGIR
ncbi:MAG TPA: phospholipase D-like domain-containing protein [Chloroflexota bacterium]|nr:phospholipase D-like domain-containing protein [Chloroflexota bacterium]